MPSPVPDTANAGMNLSTSLIKAVLAKLLKEFQQVANELQDLQAVAAALDATVKAEQAKVAAAVQVIADLRNAVSQPGIDPAAVAAVTAILNGDNAALVTGNAALDAAVAAPAPVPAPAPAAPAA